MLCEHTIYYLIVKALGNRMIGPNLCVLMLIYVQCWFVEYNYIYGIIKHNLTWKWVLVVIIWYFLFALSCHFCFVFVDWYGQVLCYYLQKCITCECPIASFALFVHLFEYFISVIQYILNCIILRHSKKVWGMNEKKNYCSAVNDFCFLSCLFKLWDVFTQNFQFSECCQKNLLWQ